MTRLVRFARFAAAALTLWLGGLSHGLAAEVIHSFDSTAVLAKNGELTVTERIRVHAERSSIKRGIFRDFPLTFTDAQGKRHEVSFTLLDVTRDGEPEPHSTERVRGNNSVLRIYAGDKKVRLQRGDYTYVIRYRTARQVRWIDGTPELNWNVTGNFWAFPILAASYRLELADKMEPTRWTAFTGPSGARGADWRGAIDDDGALTVSTTQPLRAQEGLTVVTALPDGAIAPPTQADELWYSLVDNRTWTFAGVGFLLVLGYYAAAWNAVGRDPKRGVIIPLFHPPKGISPALANYIENWGLQKWRAFTAAALSLAVQGLVRFDNGAGALTLKATGKDPEGRPPLAADERAIMDKLNATRGTLVIDKENGETVAEVGNEFTAAIVSGNKKRFFRRNLGYDLIGVLLTVAVLHGILVYGEPSVEDIVAIVGIFAALNGLFIYLMRAPTALGGPIMDQLAGLKLYLQTAESDRLNLQAPEITSERFEALLPYAVALNVEKPWSDAFAAAVKRANPENADPMHHYQPAWTNSSWSSSDFGSAIASTVASTAIALSSSMPVSSSSSGFSSDGGGSGDSGGSGGGGGGGGGGGW